MSVQIMVYGYLAVCASMIVFNLVYLAIFNRGERNSRRTDKRIKAKIREQVLQLEDGQDVSQEHIDMLCRKCTNIWDFVSLDEEISQLSEEHHDAAEKYIDQISGLFSHLAVALKRKDYIQQAHFAYMVEKYHIAEGRSVPAIMSFMLSMASSPNLYCRQNALKVLYASGDKDAVEEAIQIISNSQYFHHEKLLIDGLLSFKGDREELISDFLSKRKRYNLSMQLVILNFVRFGSGSHAEEFFEILQDEKEDNELRFSALRYFGKYYYGPAEKILQDYAKHPEKQRWEYAAISASALALYPGDETISILKNCLSNSNWYIRYNAAISLERFNLSYIELADVYDGNDRYAREILQYRMEMINLKKLAKEVKTA